MICESCQVAGFYNQEAEDSSALGGEQARNLEQCRKAHDRCRGGTWCDCQHKTGKWANDESQSAS